MQSEGEEPNSVPESRSEHPRQRQSTDYTSSFQRRPPLSRSRPEENSGAQPVSAQQSETSAVDDAKSDDSAISTPLQQTATPNEGYQRAPHIPPPAQSPQTISATNDTQPPADAEPVPQRMTFTPPPKKQRSKLATGLFALAGAVILAGGMIMLLHIQAAKNNPTTVMNDAIKNNLSVKNVESNTQTNNSDIATKYDLTSLKNPTVSSSATLTLPKGNIHIDSYGSAKNTFISYKELPKTINKDLASHTKNGWILLRSNGTAPKNANQVIVNLSDPRYQIYGPLIMGNLPANIQQQLINFIKEHKIYAFNEKSVKKEQVGGQKMFVYEVTPNVSYLKIASQSAAASVGFDPTEIQPAIDAMEQLKGAKVTFYIGAKDHKFAMVKISKDGKTKTISYTNYNKTELPDAPQTKLAWPTFSQLQTLIDNQTGLTTATY